MTLEKQPNQTEPNQSTEKKNKHENIRNNDAFCTNEIFPSFILLDDVY